jgi:hypothetical protein
MLNGNGNGIYELEGNGVRKFPLDGSYPVSGAIGCYKDRKTGTIKAGENIPAYYAVYISALKVAMIASKSEEHAVVGPNLSDGQVNTNGDLHFGVAGSAILRLDATVGGVSAKDTLVLSDTTPGTFCKQTVSGPYLAIASENGAAEGVVNVIWGKGYRVIPGD